MQASANIKHGMANGIVATSTVCHLPNNNPLVDDLTMTSGSVNNKRMQMVRNTMWRAYVHLWTFYMSQDLHFHGKRGCTY